MKNLFNKYPFIFDLLIIFILSLTPLLWFQKDTLMVGHDNVFPLNPSVFLNGRLFSWIDLEFGRSQALIMGTIPIHLIDAIPYLLGFSIQITQKIVYVFWFFMMGIAAYILASVINKESFFFKLTSVIFYVFNFFILQAWWIGERTKFSAYIAFPLIIAVFLKVYKGDIKVIKGAILTSLILFVFNGGGLYGLSLYGGFFVAITAFIIFFFLLSIWQKQYITIKRLLLLTVFSIVGFLLVNSYYIFPAFSQIASKYTEGVQKSGGLSGFVDWASEISANASYSNLMRLQGIAEWYDNPEHPYSKLFLTHPLLIFVSFLWPSIIFLSLLLIKKRSRLKFVIYFFIVYLVGIFFAAGTHPPFGFLYTLFIKHVPGSIAFRSPYFKFAPAIFLASSFLIAFFVDYFSGKTKKIVFFLLILIVLIYHFPYFTGDFFTWRKGFSTRNEVPNYVFEFGKWAENEMSKDSRVLLLPQENNDWQYEVYKWGYLSLQTLPTLVTNKGVVVNNDKISSDEMISIQKLYSAIEEKNLAVTKKLATVLGVKYFLIRYDFESELEWIRANNPNYYKAILEKSFNMSPIKQFDKWVLYEINQDTESKFTIVNRIENFYGSHKKIDDYYAFNDNESNFVFSSDSKSYLNIDTFEYVIPACLNCRHELSPNINFPRRPILPGSIFYFIVKYKEQKEMQNATSKEAVYVDLGHLLKRTGEVITTMDQGNKITPNLLNNYLNVLQKINIHFNTIESYQDRFETAEDINYYLIPQKKYLYQLLGSKINEKETLEKADEIFEEIFKIERIIDPYLFKLDSSNNRLFQFNLKNKNSYEIFLKKREIESLVKDKSEFKLLLDGQEKREIKINNDSFNNEWFSFGKFNISSGNHTLLLSLPSLPNLVENFSQKNDWLGAKVGNNCYGANIKNYNNKKDYKLSLKLDNDFSEKMYLYEVKNRNGKDHLDNVVKFEKHFEEDNYENIIYSSNELNNVSIYICAPALNNDILQNKIQIKVTEVIHPSLIIKPQIKAEYFKKNLSYQKINPTKYIIDIDNDRLNYLIFSERYDKGWKLSYFNNNHFKVNGYANGWHIDKVGKYKLVLEYQPQKYFYYGIIVSLISIIGGLIYLIRVRGKQN